MNNKGFTLIELLAVIVVLSVILVIAVPSIMGVTSNLQSKMLEEKIEIIEEAAVLLGQDIKNSVMASSLTYNGNPCKSIIVSDLVPTYLDKDNDNTCLSTGSTEEIGCIVDPSNESNYLDTLEVIIYYKNKRIKAIVDTDDTLSCS